MANQVKGSNWAWVTHFLAIFFAIMSMGLITYCIIRIDSLDTAKVVMGFASSILGVILGFYFNRERLSAEASNKDYFNSQYIDLLANHSELRTEHKELIRTLSETIAKAKVD